MLLSSGLFTLTLSTAVSEATPTTTEPTTPVVSSSIGQSHLNERFYTLSSVSGSISAARLARIHRQTSERTGTERAQEIKPVSEEQPAREEDKKVRLCVTFYLWEGRNNII